MGLMDQLLGAGQQRQEYQDFTQRYERGAPYEGMSGQEAYDRYQQVTPHLSNEEYEMSATESFQRMSPQDRGQFAQMLQQQGQARGQDLGFMDRNGDGIDDRYQDPRELARATSRLRQQQPGMLEQLLGGGGGGMGGGGMGGGMGGGAGMGAGNMLDNPLAKAALAGVAAMAVKRAMGQR